MVFYGLRFRKIQSKQTQKQSRTKQSKKIFFSRDRLGFLRIYIWVGSLKPNHLYFTLHLHKWVQRPEKYVIQYRFWYR